MSAWVRRFLATDVGNLFLKVDIDYVRDSFNLTGLREQSGFGSSPRYRAALEAIRGLSEPSSPEAESDARHVYGLVHARFILTAHGLREMYKRLKEGVYESCPRAACKGVTCLPYGEHEETGKSRLRIFCPCCNEVYIPRSPIYSQIDGAYFGPSYILLFVRYYPDVLHPVQAPELRLFGFRIKTEESESEEE